MHNNLALRMLLDAAIVACIFLGWWFIALPVAVLCAWMLPCYLELVGEGLLYDSLYGLGRDLGIFGFLGIIVSLVLGVVIILLKAIVKM
jgi:hypothetical protein